MNKTKRRTTFLMKERNFLSGVGSVFAVFGDEDMFNTSNSVREADARAIRSDWEMVGEDFNREIGKNLFS